ncbi:TlpA family protein disulfide reductase [Flagellimonas onchidii]|uniref:TlpA family protein disulfide reductase n=1 Tax=Flagellimonas onchidii TaxID=2562684 RepID=UPI0010A61B11|nr:TlpA disulfide reductase family protein [Allomuricauda onchidii]
MKCLNSAVAFLIMFIVVLSCRVDKESYVILNGAVENISVDTIHVRKQKVSERDDLYFTIVVEGDNFSFLDTLHKVDRGYYYLEYNNARHNIYLQPDFDLWLKITSQGISFKGKGAAENMYLADKQALVGKLFHLTHYSYYPKLTEKKFLRLNDSIENVLLSFLSKKEVENDFFNELERKVFLAEKAHRLMNFEVLRRLTTNDKSFKVSNDYPDVIELLNINDNQWLDVPFFAPTLAINDYYFLKNVVDLDTNGDILKCIDCDLHLEKMSFISNYFTNQKVKDEVGYVAAKWRMGKTEELDEFHKIFDQAILNDDYKQELFTLYGALKNNLGSKFLRQVSLIDENGEEASLKSFKGNYVYIDIWASFCEPCIAEFPYLNQLSRDLGKENIKFVGINKDDTFTKWKDFIRKHEVKGVQLKTNNNPEFIELLGIESIPRYILLDDFGNIIHHNAKRPSDPTLKKDLITLINMKN